MVATHEYVVDQTRLAPYHRLGVKMDPGTNLPDAMLEAHLLGWNVHLSPTFTMVGDSEQDLRLLDIPDRYANVAYDPHHKGSYLIVGNDLTDSYTNVQNEEVAAFGAEVVHAAEKELIVDAAGSYMGGTKCFVNFRQPDFIEVGGGLTTNILLAWGHDGSTAIVLKRTSTVNFCTNQIGSMLGEATTPAFKVRHTGTTIEGKVQQAREALQIMAKGESELEKAVAEWAAKKVTDHAFDKIVAELLPDVEEGMSPGAATRRVQRQTTLRELYDGNPMRGTAWGALNAWTEMGDWYGSFADADAAALAQIQSPALEARRIRGARVIAENVSGKALVHVG